MGEGRGVCWWERVGLVAGEGGGDSWRVCASSMHEGVDTHPTSLSMLGSGLGLGLGSGHGDAPNLAEQIEVTAVRRSAQVGQWQRAAAKLWEGAAKHCVLQRAKPNVGVDARACKCRRGAGFGGKAADQPSGDRLAGRQSIRRRLARAAAAAIDAALRLRGVKAALRLRGVNAALCGRQLREEAAHVCCDAKGCGIGAERAHLPH